jgi:TP901-1 family phage major tail protein
MADTILNGTDIGIYVGGTKIAGCTSHSTSTSHSLRDATSKDSGGWSESLEGLREWSGEGEGFFAHDATYGYDELFALMQSRGVVTIRFSNETSGDEYHEGQAFLTELSADAPVEDSTTFSFSFQGTGALNYKALT